jgi:orotidine-5'-phosphate decarboxylase
LQELGHRIFLDLKFHDIPNTVAGASASAARLRVSLFTVHALGGGPMIARAVTASREATPAGAVPPVVLAVTILTSHDDSELTRIGIDGPASQAVPRLAALARDAGAGGIVCSPLEAASARLAFPKAMIVVPGIRGAASEAPANDDQARVATPSAAVRSGADAIVVGRPITQAGDPAAAAAAIADDLRRNAGQ